MRRSRLAGAVGIAAVTALAAAAPLVGAGAGWRAPIALSGAALGVADPHVAMSGTGEAVVVWERLGEDTGAIEAAVRSSGRFSAPAVISLDQGRYGWSDFPRVAIGDSGEAVALWQQGCGYDVDSVRVLAAARAPGGAFGAPVVLSAPGSRPATDADVRMDAAGNATAVWMSADRRLRVAFRPAGGAFGAPRVIGDSTGATEGPFAGLQGAAFAVGGQGEAVIGWSGAAGSEQAVVRGPDGAFGAPVTLASGAADEIGLTPTVAMNDRGDAVAVWSTYAGQGSSPIRAAFRPAGGSFGPPMTVGELRFALSSPEVMLDAEGDATVAWLEPGPDPARQSVMLMTSTRPAGGTFGAPEQVAVTGPQMGTSYPFDNPFEIAYDREGGLVAVLPDWSPGDYWNPPTGRLMGAVRAPGAAPWGTLETVADDAPRYAGEPDLAAGPAGQALAVWTTRTGDGGATVQAASLGADQTAADPAALAVQDAGPAGDPCPASSAQIHGDPPPVMPHGDPPPPSNTGDPAPQPAAPLATQPDTVDAPAPPAPPVADLVGTTAVTIRASTVSVALQAAGAAGMVS